MATFRERFNAHFPIVLQLISTASLVVLALGAICGSQSLKKIAESHASQTAEGIHQDHHHMHNKSRMR